MRAAPPTRARARRLLGALALGGALASTASCGSDETADASTEVSATEHNEADVQFATEMVQHHAQALSMVDLTLGRDLDPEVAALAEEIRAAQAPEIETMTDWLVGWDEEVPATSRDHAHAGHGGEEGAEIEDAEMAGMPGMVSADQLAALEDASAAEFEQRWLELMVAHHEGAISMAEAEQEQGRYAPAVGLAGEVVTSQTAEIETMQELLGS